MTEATTTLTRADRKRIKELERDLLRNGATVLQGPVAAFSDNQALDDNYLG